jgi:hypothetical protein
VIYAPQDFVENRITTPRAVSYSLEDTVRNKKEVIQCYDKLGNSGQAYSTEGLKHQTKCYVHK